MSKLFGSIVNDVAHSHKISVAYTFVYCIRMEIRNYAASDNTKA
jgi:hypothetical protein